MQIRQFAVCHDDIAERHIAGVFQRKTVFDVVAGITNNGVPVAVLYLVGLEQRDGWLRFRLDGHVRRTRGRHHRDSTSTAACGGGVGTRGVAIRQRICQLQRVLVGIAAIQSRLRSCCQRDRRADQARQGGVTDIDIADRHHAGVGHLKGICDDIARVAEDRVAVAVSNTGRLVQRKGRPALIRRIERCCRCSAVVGGARIGLFQRRHCLQVTRSADRTGQRERDCRTAGRQRRNRPRSGLRIVATRTRLKVAQREIQRQRDGGDYLAGITQALVGQRQRKADRISAAQRLRSVVAGSQRQIRMFHTQRGEVVGKESEVGVAAEGMPKSHHLLVIAGVNAEIRQFVGQHAQITAAVCTRTVEGATRVVATSNRRIKRPGLFPHW